VIPWLVLLQATLSIATAGPPTAPEYLPLWVAQSEGYFADEKLDVSLDAARADAPAADALNRGQVELAATSLWTAVVRASVGGTPPSVVFGLTAAPAVALLVPTARKEAIRGLADLIDQTVGVAGPSTPAEFVLPALLAKENISASKVMLRSFGERGLAGAIEADQVAAGLIGDPYATRLVKEGKAVALIDLRRPGETARWLGEPGVYSAIFARSDTKVGAAQLKPLSRALLRAIALIQTAPPDDLRAKLPEAVVGFPEDFSLRVLGARHIFLKDGLVTPDMLSAGIAMVRTHGPIPDRVKFPRNMGRLLLMAPLKDVLASEAPPAASEAPPSQ